MDDARWMTYRELSEELGISLRAAEARARRNVRAGRWRHRIDNDEHRAARVLVPAVELDVMRQQGTAGDTDPLTAGDTEGDTQGGMDAHTVNALLAELKTAHERIVEELQRRAERAEGEAAGLREAVGQEQGRVVAARAEVAAAQERAGRAEAESGLLRDQVKTEQDRATRAEAEREDARMGRAAAEAGLKGMREALADARRPFWRRWLGP